MSEHDEQTELIQWKWLNMGKYPELVNLFAIPNGGARDIVTGRKLKDEGVVAGIPDLFLAVPRGAYSGLFLEMKLKPNKPSAVQLEVMNNLRKQNYAVHVCYGADEAIEVITEYLRGASWSQRDLLEWVSQKYTKT